MAGSVFKKIGEVVEGFTTLEVKTKIVDGPTKEISTKVNVVTGDAEFAIHKDFVPDIANLAALHEKQVAESREIIAATIKALADLGEKVGDKVEAYLQSDDGT